MANPRDCEGNELPWSDRPCAPGDYDSPICYVVPPATDVLPGFKRITLDVNCFATATQILDQALAPVPGAVETGCPSPCSVGCSTGDCADIQAVFPASGAALPGDEFLASRGGSCIRVTAPDSSIACPYEAPCDGSCTTPAYSFATDPSSGLWYGTIGDGPTSVNLSFGECNSYVAVANASIYINSNEITLNATSSFLSLQAGGGEFRIDAGGEWNLSSDPGTAGQVLTSQGAGAEPIWTSIAGATFPLAASNGSCAAPSYSFAADTTSGLLYEPGVPAVTLGFDTCSSFVRVGDVVRIEAANGDFIEVGASINVIGASGAAPAVITITAGAGVGVSGASVAISGGAGPAGAFSGGAVVLAGGVTGDGAVGASLFTEGGQSDDDGGDFILAAGTTTAGGDRGFGNFSGRELRFATTTAATGAATNRLNISGAGAFDFTGSSSWTLSGTAGTAGQYLSSGGVGVTPTWATLPTYAASAQIVWAAANIGSAAETRVIPVGYDDTLISTQTPKGYSAPRAGTFRNMYVRTNTANGNGASVTYTLRVNGVATAFSVTRATGAIGTSTNLVTTVAVAAGDLIEMLAIKPASIGSGVQEVFVSAEFA